MQRLRVVNALRTAEDALGLALTVIEAHVKAKELYEGHGLSKAKVLSTIKGAKVVAENTSKEVNIL